jgi:ACT domain-containing protein
LFGKVNQNQQKTDSKGLEICYNKRTKKGELVMKAFITVVGHDTVGVIAKVAGLCAELNINVEDVTQSILQGMFAMIMLVDISNCKVSHDEMHSRFSALSKDMKMQINVTRQEVFDAMHTI